MRILFDHGTPAPLRSFLTDHTVLEAKAQGWDTFKNAMANLAVARSPHGGRDQRRDPGEFHRG